MKLNAREIMKHSLFHEKMKLADLLLANYRLLYVFPSFDIGLGFGEATVAQACREKRIPAELFLLVCNVYTFDDYIPDIRTLTQIPLEDLMKYLRNSHKDYLRNRMPRIIDSIHDLTKGWQASHREMLTGFCEKYRKEVVAHFNYEEQTVFPYITALLNGETSGNYHIKEYEGNHTNIDAALGDLKNILIKYLPGECSLEKCREILIELFLFEADLYKHTLLEDRILISLVERIENQGDERTKEI